MKNVALEKLIVANPSICHEKPIFKGTRVIVWQVLELLQAGQSKEDILRAYPTLPDKFVEAALHYASNKIQNISYIPTNGPKTKNSSR